MPAILYNVMNRKIYQADIVLLRGMNQLASQMINRGIVSVIVNIRIAFIKMCIRDSVRAVDDDKSNREKERQREADKITEFERR